MLQSPLERVLGSTLTLRPTPLIYSITIFEGLLIAMSCAPWGREEIVLGMSGPCWWNSLSGKGKAVEVEWASAFQEVSTTFSVFRAQIILVQQHLLLSPLAWPHAEYREMRKKRSQGPLFRVHYWWCWWWAQIGTPSGSYLLQRTWMPTILITAVNILHLDLH